MNIERRTDLFNWDGDKAAPRPAAAMICVRPDDNVGFELLLVQRPAGSTFAGGQFVFPGGKVAEQDAAGAERLRQAGLHIDDAPGDVDAQRWQGFAAAAVRELYEETGLLPGIGEAAVLGEPVDIEAEDAFWEALDRVAPELGTGVVAGWNNWITPVVIPVRFDTWFFVTMVPAGTEPKLHTTEVASGIWVHPADALRRAAKDVPMMFPTLRNLEQIAAIRTIEELLSFARAFPKAPILPKVERDDAGFMSMRMPDFWPVPSTE
ncbi:MAG: NUDIX domain-containing protein [Candidatus Dadabacteria bacterium]|nr:MAG: NUDIX domain-containing protein [Candidatus Dadabacteria bacterium]